MSYIIYGVAGSVLIIILYVIGDMSGFPYPHEVLSLMTGKPKTVSKLKRGARATVILKDYGVEGTLDPVRPPKYIGVNKEGHKEYAIHLIGDPSSYIITDDVNHYVCKMPIKFLTGEYPDANRLGWIIGKNLNNDLFATTIETLEAQNLQLKNVNKNMARNIGEIIDQDTQPYKQIKNLFYGGGYNNDFGMQHRSNEIYGNRPHNMNDEEEYGLR